MSRRTTYLHSTSRLHMGVLTRRKHLHLDGWILSAMTDGMLPQVSFLLLVRGCSVHSRYILPCSVNYDLLGRCAHWYSPLDTVVV